jgi:hypothetical protein
MESNYKNFSFVKEFDQIIERASEGYDGTKEEQFKQFAEDLQYGGCISGMISEFIYNYDCKEFYINHIEDMEEMKEDLEDMFGMPIENRHKLPHYTFICHLCFEEYVNDIYNRLTDED